jgi:hypothetical protein|tara:strand:+ start:481 stop:672 length:192 start_codon:yes stop_codon:yes gene_type:complete
MILGDLIEDLQQLAEEYGRDIDIEINVDPNNPDSALYSKVNNMLDVDNVITGVDFGTVFQLIK